MNETQQAQGVPQPTQLAVRQRPGDELMGLAQVAPIKMGTDTVQGFAALVRAAHYFAQSDIVPEQYRGNVGNCVVALDVANRLGMSPILVMQNLYLVYGRLGWQGQFVIAIVNQSGKFSRLDWEWRSEKGKDDWGCRAIATDLASGQVLAGAWIDWKMAKAEGWTTKSGSKWQTMPEQMFTYRAASFWMRRFFPEGLMGLPTAEEIVDADPASGASGGGAQVRPLRPQAQAPAPAPSPEPPRDGRVVDVEVVGVPETPKSEANPRIAAWLAHIAESERTPEAQARLAAEVAASFGEALPPEVAKALEAARAETEGRAKEKAPVQPAQPVPQPRAATAPCRGSKLRLLLSEEQARARKAPCPACKKVVGLRVGSEDGQPAATVPVHEPAEASQTSLPVAGEGRVREILAQIAAARDVEAIDATIALIDDEFPEQSPAASMLLQAASAQRAVLSSERQPGGEG